jgi:hypothetical protein
MDEQPQQRTVQTETPYLMAVTIPFTSNPAEEATVRTKAALAIGNGDVEVLGLTCDLVGVSGAFSINRKSIWSDTRVPLPMLCGKPDGPKPILWLDRPLTVSQGLVIQADLLNDGGEPAGTLVYVCRVKGVNSPRVSVPEGIGIEEIITIDSGFTATADERKRVATNLIDEDMLLYALHTNLDSATLNVIGIDGVPWNEDPVPTWALAGRAGSTLPVPRLRKPYLIPAGYKIVVEFINVGAEAAGQLYVRGLRLPKGSGVWQ